MGEYIRLISYIYSYERGTKSKNAGFAKIESRNGVCKVNISLRIDDSLVNETEDNMLEVFFFYRGDNGIKKVFLDRIKIVSGCSTLKLRMNSENIGNKSVPLSKITGIFICSSAYLKNKSSLNVIYASEWDDIPIVVENFKDGALNIEKEKDGLISGPLAASQEENELHSDILQGNNTFVLQASELETIETDQIKVDQIKVDKIKVDKIKDDQKEVNQIEAEPKKIESNIMEPKVMESLVVQKDFEEEKIKDNDTAEEVVLEASQEDDIKEYQQNLLNGNEQNTNFFTMLSKCYPKIKVSEIDGDCIKITPHDLSYLPKRYWNLCNNSFLLHGYYNYKYLLLCEKNLEKGKRYAIGVPGLFHQKEQMIARMFGFTEFEGSKQNDSMNFGYWCIYL